MQLAAIELERGDSAAARRWLERVRLAQLDRGDLRNAYRVFAETSTRPADRVRWLALLRGEVSDPAESDAIDSEIDRALGELPVSELELAARQVGDRPPVGHVYTALAERALVEGDRDAAREAAEKARKTTLAPRYATRLAAVESRLGRSDEAVPDAGQLQSFADVMNRPAPDFSSARGALGVVLPLSGPFAGFGEQALRGVLLAAGVFPGAEGGAHPTMRIAVRDSGSDPARAAAAVRELAADPEMVAIVGPLVSATCESAAREAESIGVPLLALTSREDVTSQRSWVFRLRTRPIEEAELVADRAMALGARRFAILYPNDPSGVGLRGLFWDAVEARGGRVVAVAAFDPKATDFGAADQEPGRLHAARFRREGAAREPLGDARARAPPPARGCARAAHQGEGPHHQRRSPDSADRRLRRALHPRRARRRGADRRAARLSRGDRRAPARLGGLVRPEARAARRRVRSRARCSPPTSIPRARSPTCSRSASATRRRSAPFPMRSRRRATTRRVWSSLSSRTVGTTARDVRDGLRKIASFPGVSGVTSIGADGNARKRPFLLGVEHGRVVQYTD